MIKFCIFTLVFLLIGLPISTLISLAFDVNVIDGITITGFSYFGGFLVDDIIEYIDEKRSR